MAVLEIKLLMMIKMDVFVHQTQLINKIMFVNVIILCKQSLMEFAAVVMEKLLILLIKNVYVKTEIWC